MPKFTDKEFYRSIESRSGFATATIAAATATAIGPVPGATEKVRVTRYAISALNACNAYFQSGAAGAQISGTKYMTAGGGYAGGEAVEQGHFETAAGQQLYIVTSTSGPVSLDVAYTLETVRQ